jgi:hypothetical protein
MYRFLAWLLRSWADYATAEALREARVEISSLRSRLTIEEAEVERLGLNHRKWCETLKAETSAQVARSALALGEGSTGRAE